MALLMVSEGLVHCHLVLCAGQRVHSDRSPMCMTAVYLMGNQIKKRRHCLLLAFSFPILLYLEP